MIFIPEDIGWSFTEYVKAARSKKEGKVGFQACYCIKIIRYQLG